MRHFTLVLCVAAIAACLTVVPEKTASAQYPYYYAPVQPVVPAVIGYTARRRGLFGRRVVVRPIVAPVVAAPMVIARPVVTARYGYVAPATAYYPPPVPVVAPVMTYRVPYAAYYPVW